VWDRLAVLYGEVADAVADAAGRGAAPLVVSGDCLSALGVVAGLQRTVGDPGVVWFDAHGDVQTLETTTSGYLGGLPLRLLAGYRPELIATRLGLRPVPARRMMLAGARDLDPPEVSYLEDVQMPRSPVAGLETVDLPAGPLYVHLDMDVLDPAEAPGLRYPAPGGPSAAEVADALHLLLGTGRVAAVNVACTWYPGHGTAARVSPHLAAAFAAG
jgi:arginase